jgi:hypothetical protein
VSRRPSFTLFGELIRTDPDKARALFLDAYKAAQGCRRLMRDWLDASSVAQFYRWVEKLGFKMTRLDRMAKKKKWPLHTNRGGAGYHKDRATQRAKAEATMRERGVWVGRKPAKKV